MQETLICMGSFERNPKQEPLFAIRVGARFIDPLLRFEPEGIRFVVHTRNNNNNNNNNSSNNSNNNNSNNIINNTSNAQHMMTQKLVVSNVSTLSLTVSMQCTTPFTIETTEFTIKPLEVKPVTVSYSADHIYDSKTRVENGKITIRYAEHPRVDLVPIRAEVYYPNLEFGEKALDFGKVKCHTKCVRMVHARNTGPLPVNFSWFLAEEGSSDPKVNLSLCENI